MLRGSNPVRGTNTADDCFSDYDSFGESLMSSNSQALILRSSASRYKSVNGARSSVG